jgi:hypothetical protein
MSVHYTLKVKVKESRNRPGVAQRVPGGLGSQIFMTFGTWIWWGRQPHAPAAFTPGMFLVLIFTRGWVDPRAMVRSEGSMSLKNPVTPQGIDPGTVRLVAKRLNHYATPGPTVHWRPNNNVRCNAIKTWNLIFELILPFHVKNFCITLQYEGSAGLFSQGELQKGPRYTLFDL